MKFSQNKNKFDLKKTYVRQQKIAKYLKILQFLMIAWLVYRSLV